MKLLEVKCKRCGQALLTTAKSLHGLDTLKAAFGALCEQCVTPDERYALNRAIGEGIARVYGKTEKEA